MTRLMLNAILFLTLLTYSVAANAAADAEGVAATLEQLRQSINANDYGQLESSLDASVRAWCSASAIRISSNVSGSLV